MPKGKFIVIEGLDGSGKSAQVDLLVNFLQSAGKEVMLTREPTMDSESGRTIKQVLKGEIIMEALELQKLYVQDRKEHLENKVIPALEQGKFVVSSRYFFSTIAYGHADGLDVNLLAKMNQDFLLPDETIFVLANNTLFIIEMKFQKVAGSVDEKLQTCDFKKKQYEKLLSGTGIRVEYCYILSE